jgi:hypothetical protein
MSRQRSAGGSSQRMTGAHRRRRYGRSVAVTVALVAGLAACGGDDDDAADSTSAPETTGVDATAPETTVPAEITAAHDTTGSEPSDTTTDGTTDETTAESSEPEAAGPEGTGSDTTEQPDGAAVVAASEDSEAAADTTAGDETEGTALDVGPTTTGPACEFEENSSLPLERCNMGPAVAVVQSILQANGYEVGIDGNFGDQTLYALRAFQEEEGLTVDGIVGLQTWTELGVDEQFGTDENGDGVIAPDELDLGE